MISGKRTLNPNLLRGTLYGVGASLWIGALLAAFLTHWYWLLLIAGAILIMAGGCVPRVDEPDDDWFNPEHRPVWPNDAILGGRNFDTEQWEALVSFVWLRRHGGDPGRKDTLHVTVEIDNYEDDEDLLAEIGETPGVDIRVES